MSDGSKSPLDLIDEAHSEITDKNDYSSQSDSENSLDDFSPEEHRGEAKKAIDRALGYEVLEDTDTYFTVEISLDGIEEGDHGSPAGSVESEFLNESYGVLVETVDTFGNFDVKERNDDQYRLTVEGDADTLRRIYRESEDDMRDTSFIGIDEI